MKVIGVIDVGKTHIKLYLLSDTLAAEVITSWQIANEVVNESPYPHFASEQHWQWLLDRFKEASQNYPISKLITTAHGASAVLLAGDELAMPILDYEHSGPESCVGYPYPPFSETFSPPLPLGLNVGRQLYWQQQQFPDLFQRATAILPYPQYWAWRLSGVAANEYTSIGAHTDLWLPQQRTYSALAQQQGWDKLYPPLHNAWDVLGLIKPEIAAATGLPADCQILTGVHDSNASLLPHLLSQERPFTVVSTGTWVIIMSIGADLAALDPTEDTLGNVNVLGDPIACARFMGGREYAILTDGARADDHEVLQAAQSLIQQRVFALPNWTQSGGPLPNQEGKIIGDLPDNPAAKIALASLYCALMVNCSLNAVGATHGTLIIEGSFIKNLLFCEVLSYLRPQQPVVISEDFAGTMRGAAILANWSQREVIATPPLTQLAKACLTVDSVRAYANEWIKLTTR